MGMKMNSENIVREKWCVEGSWRTQGKCIPIMIKHPKYLLGTHPTYQLTSHLRQSLYTLSLSSFYYCIDLTNKNQLYSFKFSKLGELQQNSTLILNQIYSVLSQFKVVSLRWSQMEEMKATLQSQGGNGYYQDLIVP